MKNRMEFGGYIGRPDTQKMYGDVQGSGATALRCPYYNAFDALGHMNYSLHSLRCIGFLRGILEV